MIKAGKYAISILTFVLFLLLSLGFQDPIKAFGLTLMALLGILALVTYTILVLVVFLAWHELGHWIMGRLVRTRLVVLELCGFGFVKIDDRWLPYRPGHIGALVTMAREDRPLSKPEMLRFVIGGPLASFISFTIVAAIGVIYVPWQRSGLGFLYWFPAYFSLVMVLVSFISSKHLTADWPLYRQIKKSKNFEHLSQLSFRWNTMIRQGIAHKDWDIDLVKECEELPPNNPLASGLKEIPYLWYEAQANFAKALVYLNQRLHSPGLLFRRKILLFAKANCLAELGRVDEALEAFEEAKRIKASNLGGTAKFAEAHLRFLDGDNEGALESLGKAREAYEHMVAKDSPLRVSERKAYDRFEDRIRNRKSS